jgi:uncharacterized YigZ family protein
MLFEDTYKTIESSSTGLYKEKGSKFLAFAYPVRTEMEVKKILEELRKEYYDARHHCYSYVLGYDKSAWRINDDGEPSGTAGKPIYGQIQSMDLTNILVVVIRYFGGIKLGVSGLINAYKLSALDALKNASVSERTINEIYRLHFPYEMINDAMRLVKDEGLQIIQSSYYSDAFLDVKMRRNIVQKVISRSQQLYRFKMIYIGTE